MGSIYHHKFHRHNHHTTPIGDTRYPDASYDPIASPDSPFLGQFTLAGPLSAYQGSNQSTAFFSGLTALNTKGVTVLDGNTSLVNNSSLFVSGSATIQGSLTVAGTLVFNDTVVTTITSGVVTGDLSVAGKIIGAQTLTLGSDVSATGTTSFAMGSGSRAGGTASIAVGLSSQSNFTGEIAQSSGGFTQTGDAQSSRLTLRRQTTNATPTLVSIDGNTANTYITVPSNTIYGFTARLVGSTSTGSEVVYHTHQGVVKNTGGGAQIVGAYQSFGFGDNNTWTSQPSATGTTFSIRVVGAAGTTIRWVATVDLTRIML